MKIFFEVMLIAIFANLIMRLLYQCLKWITSKSLITSILLTFLFLILISIFYPSVFNFLPILPNEITTKALIEIVLTITHGTAFLYLIYGGIKWLTSGGDKSNIESAEGHIVAGSIGIIPFAGAYFFVFFFLPPVSLDLLSITSLSLAGLEMLLSVSSLLPILGKLRGDFFPDEAIQKQETIRSPNEVSSEIPLATSFADVLDIDHVPVGGGSLQNDNTGKRTDDKEPHKLPQQKPLDENDHSQESYYPPEKLHHHEVTKPPISDETKSFDVFLCYNRKDKLAVRGLAKRLQERNIVPWLDEWELRPGLPWLPSLEEQISQIRSVAVCIGEKGIGPWQQKELNAALHEFVSRGCPVIPVLLTNVSSVPKLPPFLRGMTWVDFSIQDPDPMKHLIWGITGKRPEDNEPEGEVYSDEREG